MGGVLTPLSKRVSGFGLRVLGFRWFEGAGLRVSGFQGAGVEGALEGSCAPIAEVSSPLNPNPSP